jgi:hypothetical protein
LHRLLRILVLLHVPGTLVFRRPIGIAMGVNAPVLASLLLTLPVPLILVALVWIPSWEGRRGRVLLPLVLRIELADTESDSIEPAWTRARISVCGGCRSVPTRWAVS